MWFFKRSKYPLPKFPPKAIPIFRAYCEILSPEDFAAIREEANTEIAKSYEDPLAEAALLDQIKKACEALMDAYPNVDDKAKSLIIGAIRYCCISDDAMSDELFAAGYIDDCKVLNHVLEEVGIAGCFIRFGR